MSCEERWPALGSNAVMAAGAAAACGGGLLSGACLGLMMSDGETGSLCKGGADKGVRLALATRLSYSRKWRLMLESSSS